MSHKKSHIVLKLDKNEVSTEICRMDYTTARRVRGPIYDVLVQELNEHGCKASAKHFRCLSDKETTLHKQKIIGYRMLNEPKLLYQIFDYCVASERAYDFRKCGGLSASFYIMYQILSLIQEKGVKYNWLLKEVFRIVMKIIRNIEPNQPQPTEMIARLYYMYGVYLSRSQEIESIKYLHRALELCRGQRWLPEYGEISDEAPCAATSGDDDEIRTLHEVVAHFLASIKVKVARSFGKFGISAHVATEMAKEAMLLVAEVGIDTRKYEFFNAFVTYAEYLAESHKFDAAMKLLKKYTVYFNQDDIKQYSRFHCKQLMIRGCCYSGFKNIKQAKKEHHQALQIARSDGYKDLEAQALVHLGMLYALKKIEYNIGKDHYENARIIFLELGDRENEKKTHYLLAKLKADEMFPFFMDLLKSTTTLPCSISKLRRWKNVCEPFWVNFSEYMRREAEEPLTCLLDVPPESTFDENRVEKPMSRLSIYKKQLEESNVSRATLSRVTAAQIRRSSYSLKMQTV